MALVKCGTEEGEFAGMRDVTVAGDCQSLGAGVDGRQIVAQADTQTLEQGLFADPDLKKGPVGVGGCGDPLPFSRTGNKIEKSRRGGVSGPTFDIDTDGSGSLRAYDHPIPCVADIGFPLVDMERTGLAVRANDDRYRRRIPIDQGTEEVAHQPTPDQAALPVDSTTVTRSSLVFGGGADHAQVREYGLGER